MSDQLTLGVLMTMGTVLAGAVAYIVKLRADIDVVKEKQSGIEKLAPDLAKAVQTLSVAVTSIIDWEQRHGQTIETIRRRQSRTTEQVRAMQEVARADVLADLAKAGADASTMQKLGAITRTWDESEAQPADTDTGRLRTATRAPA